MGNDNIKIKSLGMAKLKNNENIDDIAKDLSISPAIVKEWSEDLSPSQMLSKEVNAIAINKASELLTVDSEQDKVNLQNCLLTLAMAITDEIKMGYADAEIAKSINLSANTIAILQNAFFAKGTQIAVISTEVSNELTKFRGILRK